MRLGIAEVDVERPVVAGSHQTVRWIYTVGHPIDDTGHIMIAFRHCGDFGAPQFHNPSATGYCTVHTTGNCVIEPRWDPKGHVRPWTQCLVLSVRQGFLDSGDRVHVIFGSTDCGSPGWRIQTFPERSFEFKTLVDPMATQLYKELPSSPTLKIVPGSAERALCMAPSLVLQQRPFAYHIRLEDRWGNAVGCPMRFDHPGFDAPGVKWLVHQDEATGQALRSNPIEVVSSLKKRGRWWADLHGQSEETVGTNSIDDYYVAGRDLALLDVLAHQGNDFQITDELWATIQKAAERYNAPGKLVTFPGYEWSGNTPLGGDRNVYYISEGGGIYRSSLELIPEKVSRFPVSATAEILFHKLRTEHWLDGPTPFVVAHVGGRYADLSMHDEKLELAVEIHSAWGTFEWLLEEALQRGYRVGVVANSDDHRCSPGASYPGAKDFGSLGGLTCVLSETLTREGILEALTQRHMYATTGNRSFMEVSLSEGGTPCAMMGDIISLETSSATLHVLACGTAPIERVEIARKGRVVYVYSPPDTTKSGRRIKITWRGAEDRGRGRAASWDGELVVRHNTIVDVTPVNFLNPDRPVQCPSPQTVKWQSVTTGGLAGIIITLANPSQGTFHLATEQGHADFDLTEVLQSASPLRWEFGGLGKALTAACLPDGGGPMQVQFSALIENLLPGDNPIHVRVVQEDGHLAWSSPLYAVREV